MAKRRNPQLRIYRRHLLWLFFGLLLGAALLHAGMGDRDASIVENRVLKGRPAFSMAAFARGAYQKELMTYLEDQFPFRDTFIKMKAKVEKLVGRQENNDVYIASRDTLIGKFRLDTPEDLKEKQRVLNAFAKAHPKVEMSILLAPTKAEVLKNKLPPLAPEPSQEAFLHSFYGGLSSAYHKINVLPLFQEHHDQPLYFRADHHWTQEGAFLAQKPYLSALGFSPRTREEYDVRKVAEDFQGTLSAKSGVSTPGDVLSLFVPRKSEDLVVNLPEARKKMTSFYQMDYVEQKDKYLVFLGGNYPLVRISTSSPRDRRLLILKDSYANAFVPFMTRDFNEITLLDLRYFTGNVQQVVADYLITDVLILMNVETFNDDDSILNLGDGLNLQEKPSDTMGGVHQDVAQRKKEGLSLLAKTDPHDPGMLLVRLQNHTASAAQYQRSILLERQEGNRWQKIPTVTPQEPSDPLHSLASESNDEYAVDLKKQYGALSEGVYRVTQIVNQTVRLTAEFSLGGSKENKGSLPGNASDPKSP
ncbi:hypothetical protein ABB02_01437 [Clostridiaceae bacterium JG1575]|nr:hypothetical protein ABB02_01437 [Clostridiaceae bacterium JG1575]